MAVRGRRTLLNPPGVQTTAAIVAEVEDTRKRKPGCDRDGKTVTEFGPWSPAEPDITLQLSNCDRSISFAFGQWDTARNRRVDIQKVDRMIDALQVFREALVDEQVLYIERIKIARKIKPPKED